MREWFRKNKTIVILFLLALVPRLVFMLATFFILGDYRFVEDQDRYLISGWNLLVHGVYTGHPDVSLGPRSFPAPGYPILLAISWLIIPKYLFIVFWQNIIYSIFIVFIYKFARLFFNNFVSLGAALLMVFEPFSIFWPNVVMSEMPFLLFFMVSIYFLALFWREQKWKYIVFSAILLGLAALVRQVALYFYLLILFSSIVMLWQKITWSRLAKFLIVYLIILLAVTAPWCIRNKIQFGDYTISNQTHLLYFLGAARDFLVLSREISRAEADAYLQGLAVEKAGVEDFSQVEGVDKYIPVLKEITFSLIKEHPLTYLKWHLIKSLPVLTNSGWMKILSFWEVDSDQAASVNITNLLAQGKYSSLIVTFREDPAFLIRILGIGFWLLIDLIALLGVILMLLRKDLFKIGLTMLMIIGYIIFVSSWAAMARLRLPFQPFLFIFVAYAIYIFYLKYIRKTSYQKYA